MRTHLLLVTPIAQPTVLTSALPHLHKYVSAYYMWPGELMQAEPQLRRIRLSKRIVGLVYHDTPYNRHMMHLHRSLL